MIQNRKEDADKIYKQLNKWIDLAKYKINDEIFLIYTKKLKENDNNYANLLLPISSEEFKLLHEDIRLNIEKIKINDYDLKWENNLLILYERNNFTAFDAFKYNIRKHIEESFFNYEKDIEKRMKDMLLKIFSESCYDILESYKKELLVSSKDKSNILNMNFYIPYDYLLDININKYFLNSWSPDNINFRQRLKKYKEELLNELDQQLFYALVRGDSPENFSYIISNVIEEYKANLKAFVITESTYFINTGKILSYKALGLYKYKIKITEDEKTSQTCKEFKENIYDIKDYEVGKTAPPFHVNCRSTIESVIDEKDKENLKKFFNKENSYIDKTAVRESMDASTELIEYYKKLVNNNSSVIIGGNLTKAEEYMFISNSKVSLSDIMCVAKPEYSGNYNTDENKNNHQYKKQYKIYYNKMKEEGKEPVSFDIFLNTTIPLKKEIDNNRKKHLTPIFEKLDNFFDTFEELERVFNYSLMLENNSFKVYEDILKLQENNFDYNIKIDDLDIPVTETEIIGDVLESYINNAIDIENNITNNIVSNEIENLEFNERNGQVIKFPKDLTIDRAQFGKKVGKHASDYGLSPKDPGSRKILEDHINDIFNNYDEIRTNGWMGLGELTESGARNAGDALFYIKGDDVVVTDMAGNFVTLLKDGTKGNTRVKRGETILKK